MVGARRWWRKRRAKNRDAVVLCVLSASFLLAGELLVPVLQEVYSLYIEPVLGDPLLLTVRALLVLFAFTTSLGAFLVMTGGWYFIRHVVPRGRFLVGLGVGLTSLSLVNKLSYYTLVYGTPLAYLLPLATSLTGVGIVFGFTAHVLMGRFGQVVRRRVISAWRERRRARKGSSRSPKPRPRSRRSRVRARSSSGKSPAAPTSDDDGNQRDTEIY